LEGTNSLCVTLLTKETLDLIGSNPICGVSNDKFYIEIGGLSTINEGSEISFKNNTTPMINYNDCQEFDGTL
jgi:hypothetical protein